MAKVVPLDQPAPHEKRRIGFLAGQITVPDDFDLMGREEIEVCSASELVQSFQSYSSRLRKSHAADDRVTIAIRHRGSVWWTTSVSGMSFRNTPFTITRK